MRLSIVLYFVGVLLACVGLSMLVPLGVSLYCRDGVSFGVGAAMGISTLLGVVLAITCRQKGPLTLNNRDALGIVGLCWLGASLAGALPFALAGHLSIVDSFFESASGFTTTGASILVNVEATPASLLMWRSLTHWMGGMGIIVLSLAILPFLGVGGMQLYKVEVTGPTPDKLTPRIHDTAMLLWKVYGLMTLAEVILLLCGGMSVFDAVNQSFATVATGGFSTRNASIAAFSVYDQWVILIFMFLCGINFILHYHALFGSFKAYRLDAECIAYVCVVGLAIAFVAWSIRDLYTSFEEIIRMAAFQVISICTTTGFATADYENWPTFAQGVIVFCMFAGGCAGSTAGGIKFMRLIIIEKLFRRDLFHLLHPHSVRHLKISNRTVSPEIIHGVVGFFVTFMLLLGVGTLILSSFGLDLLTAFTAVLTCLSNVGPGFGTIGPAENFAHLPSMSKVLLSLFMLMGRLELYAVLVFFLPAFWKR